MRNSKLILCSGIKMDRNYVNVLSYSEQNMLRLCENKAIATDDNMQFIRTRNVINTDVPYGLVLECNYIAFQNPDYSNKWFFAWIDNVEYRGEKNTEISFTIDSWSTWFDYWQKKPCFINRQHVNDDTIGLHTVPENIDVGEVFSEGMFEDLSYSTEYFWIGIICNYDPITDESFDGVTCYNKSIFGSKIYLFQYTTIEDLIINLGLFVKKVNSKSKIAEVQDMFIVPDAVVKVPKLKLKEFDVPYGTGTWTVTYYELDYDEDVISFQTEIEKHYNFNGISIKNNKCFTYPYNYLYVTNNNGSNNIYKYEDFNTNKCLFSNVLALTVGISGKLFPTYYKGQTINDDEGIALGKYPTCQWSSDSYINWLTQNAVNIPMSILNTAIGIGSSVISGNANGSQILSSVSGTASNLIGQFYQASLLPNQTSSPNTGDVVFAGNRNKFTFYNMRCKNEYMKIVDNYFSRYGYKINNTEMPNITGRLNWNYVEIGTNEQIGYGTVPSIHMENINNAFRKGVTIWHNHDNLGDFTLNNAIQ